MNICDFQINENMTIIDAMKQMDKSANKILYIVKKDVLIAALTDGDIRRWILRNGDLDAPVSCAANYNPIKLPVDEKDNARTMMRTKKIESIPIVDQFGKIQSILFWNDEELENQLEKEALRVPVVMMAGGFGTRLYPYTNVLPKPLIPVGEIPIAEHIINQFVQFGCREYHLIVNFKKNMIKAYFSDVEKTYSVDYVEENEPLGTGGGLSLLKGKIHDTFILTNCDILIREDFVKIYQHHKNTGNIITMICSAKDFKIPYEIVEIDEKGNISNLREKPSMSFLTNTGCYIVEPRVIDEIEDNKKIGFPDVINMYRNKGEKVGIFPISENSWLDMGQLDELERMRINLGERK